MRSKVQETLILESRHLFDDESVVRGLVEEEAGLAPHGLPPVAVREGLDELDLALV